MWTIFLTVLCTLIVVTIALNFRTPEKDPHHKIDRQYSVRDSQLKREMGALLGPAIVAGNRVSYLQNGSKIFPAMLDAIKGARCSITFETYIYWSGSVGEQFAEALIERARSGIPVHVMLDWVGCAKMSHTTVAQMQEAGVEVARYHPPKWFDLSRLNNRTHRKLLIIDGRIGFTGGVGIADLWSGDAQDPSHWRDMHFEVEGPVVAQLQAAFLDNWINTTGSVLHGATYFPNLEERGMLESQLFISSPNGGSGSMRLMYLTAITAAKQSINIEAAYFVPDPLMIRELIAARQRGVKIRVLVPGKHIDSKMVRISSKRGWGPLLEHGVEIYEYRPTMLHCKMLIFDGYMVSIGSTNFDMRSFELNDEASLNVYDAGFAEQMDLVFEHDLESSVRRTLQGWRERPMPEKLAEIVMVPIRSQL